MVSIILIIVVAAVLGGVALHYATKWHGLLRQPQQDTAPPAVPADDELLWCEGRQMSYADARAYAAACSTGMHRYQVVVSTTTGQPAPDQPELRLAFLDQVEAVNVR